MTGQYIINLPSWSRTVYYNGTKIEYSHAANQYADSIVLDGPTKVPLRVVVSILLKKYSHVRITKPFFLYTNWLKLSVAPTIISFLECNNNILLVSNNMVEIRWPDYVLKTANICPFLYWFSGKSDINEILWFYFSMFTCMERLKEWTFSTTDLYCQTNLLRLFPQNGSLGNGLLAPAEYVVKVTLLPPTLK